jgi:hypothetical protein
MENTTPAPSVPPSVPPLKAYKFKRDYSFDNDNSISEKSALWTAKEGDIVVGRPFDHTSTTGEWIGLAGEKSGLVESDVLEEVPLTDEILQANNIIDVRNHFYERPSWLRRKWDSIREYWYYIFKAKYYIQEIR